MVGLSERTWKKEPDVEFRPAKTLWDWLQLLVVPVVLAVLAFTFNAWQSDRQQHIANKAREQDRDIASDARLDSTLQTYLTQISDLVLERHLSASREGAEVRAVARTLALTALRRLDGKRKGEVVRNLADARLLRRKGKDQYGIVHLEGADLRRADLTGANLEDVVLFGADLRNAHFEGSYLKNVDFDFADLNGAHFQDALLDGVHFGQALAGGAHFDGVRASLELHDTTRMWGTCLTGTSFRNADLTGVDFSDPRHRTIFTSARGRGLVFAGALLSGAGLEGAAFRDTKLSEAKYIEGGPPKEWGPSGSVSEKDLPNRYLDCKRPLDALKIVQGG